MMRAVLCGLILSPDLRTLPGDPAGFVFGVHLLVDPADGPGEESFELTEVFLTNVETVTRRIVPM